MFVKLSFDNVTRKNGNRKLEHCSDLRQPLLIELLAFLRAFSIEI